MTIVSPVGAAADVPAVDVVVMGTGVVVVGQYDDVAVAVSDSLGTEVAGLVYVAVLVAGTVTIGTTVGVTVGTL